MLLLHYKFTILGDNFGNAYIVFYAIKRTVAI